MREALSAYLGKEYFFTGDVVKIGYAPKRQTHSALLRNVQELSRKICIEHVWIPWSKRFVVAGVQAGKKIRFRAWVARYNKKITKHNKEPFDYGLAKIRLIEVIGDGRSYKDEEEEHYLVKRILGTSKKIRTA